MKRKTFSIIALLALVSFALFSQPMAERQYTALAAEILLLAEAQERYDSLAAAVATERTKALAALEDAQQRGDRAAYREAQQSLAALASYRMSKEQSEALQAEINALEEPERTESARWLLAQSPYYRPTLTLDFSSEGKGYRFNYRQTIRKGVGGSVKLPASDEIRFNTHHLGLLSGWESSDGAYRYRAGQEIEIPPADTTLVAVYEEGIRFVDKRSGVDEMYLLTEILAPTPKHDDEAVFLGWLDQSTGFYVPAGERVEVAGKGAFFEGFWKDLEIDQVQILSTRGRAAPGGELALNFSYYNKGDVPLGNLEATLESESEYVRILVDTRPLGSLQTGCWGSNACWMSPFFSSLDNTLRFVIDPSVERGSEISLTLVITEEGGAVWKKDVVVRVE